MKPGYILFLVLIVSASVSEAGATIVNTDLNYSVYLPDNWTLEEVRPGTQHFFYDTSGVFPALLSIVRYDRDTVKYSIPHNWTEVNYYAYKVIVEESVDPYGVVLYANDSETSLQGDLWAPEMYCEFYSFDTLADCWAEYVRFTASNRFGYELYAISDTLDMETNIGLYAAMLQYIALPEDVTSVLPGWSKHGDTPYRISTNQRASPVFTLLGRKTPYLNSDCFHGITTGIYVSSRRPVLQLR